MIKDLSTLCSHLQRSHINPRINSKAYVVFYIALFAHVSSHRLPWTHKEALSPLLPLISRTFSQHLLGIWWLYSRGYCCLPSLHLIFHHHHLHPVSSAGLSLLYHCVINYTTGSGPPSNFQLWLEKAGFQVQAKAICLLFLI